MSETRTSILTHLLREKDGLTIEELSERLGISRSGIQQHMMALQRDGLVAGSRRKPPGLGRPSRVYTLTDSGKERFPRQYALFAALALSYLREHVGREALLDALTRMAEGLFREYAHAVEGRSTKERIERTIEILNALGYQASPTPDGAGIQAVNCVFHHLALEVREVCQLDLALIERLTGGRIEHPRCMADGDHACVFKVS